MSTYLEAIDAGLVETRRAEERRGHLGYSRIGHEDERRLWLEFRWCMPQIEDPRILRIFANGHAVEQLLIDWTRQAGIHLVTENPETGKQYRFSRFGGHMGGSNDGLVYNLPEHPEEWLVWEAKSANDNRFKGLIKSSESDGRVATWEDLASTPLEAWSPEYHGQMICYIGEWGLQRGVVLVKDKNDSRLHSEFIEADPLAFQGYLSKGERIIEAEAPPEPLYSSPADWRAKLTMGEAERDVYFCNSLPPTANCRNCRFSKPRTDLKDAQWECRLHNTLIGPPERQWAGCDRHQFIQGLVPARFVKEDESGMHYKTWEGVEFSNGTGSEPNCYGSKELVELSKDGFEMMNDPTFMQLRQEMGAAVVENQQVIQKVNDGMKKMAGVMKRHEEYRKANEEGEKFHGEVFPEDDIPF